ncbi:MAG: deoxynucleoside kinase [Pseudomonadales bacterium]|jgi:deoxyguanosine kinase|nr:deoxynucleoside kinase [Pseudomonadales bacterium]MCP5322018.1 deoxynucleoside kinase [Pseudomonadales bacterium]MCP5338075.1 deoxynucleoside kinase [Pseudomonadales bacterium]
MTNRTSASLARPVAPRFIAVEGPIGAGKTTLARRLAESFGHAAMLEQAQENPFLESFYRDRARNALATQLHFLIQRARQLDTIRQSDLFQNARVSDYLIEKDRMFARVNLGADEYALYETVFERLVPSIPRPDLVIYLQAPTDVLVERIQRRGVPSEQLIERRYLEQLNEAYSQFFHYYDEAPLLIVNAATIDFANDENHYTELVDYLLNVRAGRQYFNPTFF